MLPPPVIVGMAGLAGLWWWYMAPSVGGRHFKLSELTRSAKADSLGLKNTPNATERGRLTDLINHVLDPLRDAVGQPLLVTSGFRSQAVNDAVGGASQSQHRLGEAVDFVSPGLTSVELMELLQNAGVTWDQAIAYHPSKGGHLHVSWTRRRANRKQVLYKWPDGELRSQPWS